MAAALAFGGAQQAYADFVYYGPFPGNDTSSKDVADAVGVEIVDVGELLYKSEVTGHKEEGPLRDCFDTNYSPPTDPHSASLQYIGPADMLPPVTYVVVKDGKEGFVVYDVAGWDGSKIHVTWPRFPKGSISHISVYGGQIAHHVPDAGSPVLFLGASLVLLGMGRGALLKPVS